MPDDTTPDGQGILNKPQVKPFPEPTADKDERDVRGEDEEEDEDALARRELEQQTGIARPPLGN